MRWFDHGRMTQRRRTGCDCRFLYLSVVASSPAFRKDYHTMLPVQLPESLYQHHRAYEVRGAPPKKFWFPASILVMTPIFFALFYEI
jgi:hypothetical protein